MPTTRERIAFRSGPSDETKCRPTAGNSPLPFGRVKARPVSHLSSSR
jgi:hypothetical protein